MNLRLRAIISGLFLLCVPTLSGCWDKVEIDERSYAVIVGVDKKGNELEVTYSIPNVTVVTGQGGEGENTLIKTTHGNTLFDASDHFREISSTPVSLAQAKVIVLGKSVLNDEKTLKMLVDYMDRSPEFALSLTIITTDSSAANLINQKPNSALPAGLYINQFFENTSGGDISFDKITLNDFIVEILDSKGCARLPIMDFKGNEMQISGIAFINDYLYCGQINQHEVNKYNMLRGDGNGSVHMFTYKDINMVYSISEVKREVKFKKTESGIDINIIIEIEGDILEYEIDPREKLSDQKTIDAIKKEIKDSLEEDFYDLIRRAQNEFKCDIFQSADDMKIYKGKLWNEIKDDWKSYFMSADISVEVSPRIRRIGMTY